MCADHDEIGSDVGRVVDDPFLDLALQKSGAEADTGEVRFRRLDGERRFGTREVVLIGNDGANSIEVRRSAASLMASSAARCDGVVPSTGTTIRLKMRPP